MKSTAEGNPCREERIRNDSVLGSMNLFFVPPRRVQANINNVHPKKHPCLCLQVHLRSRLIMNGVCVMWRGWIDLERLDGVGCLEYDEKRAAEEDALLRDQLERYNQRVRDFDEKQRAYRTGATQPPHLNHHHHHHHHHHGHHGHHVTGTGTGAAGTIEPHLTHRQDPEMEVRLRAY